jgi:Ca2+-binding RTX toxin-like protein
MNLANPSLNTGHAAGDIYNSIEGIWGTGSHDTLTGDRNDNALVGDMGNDMLDGGAGADALVGGLGDDTYMVDDAGDVVLEDSGGGTDTVKTSLTFYQLGESTNLENLTFIGTTGLNVGFGNGLNNVLTGSSGNDSLTGNAGNDTFVAGAGDDYLYIDRFDTTQGKATTPLGP